MNNIQIRRRILQILYEAHNSSPHNAIEREELAKILGVPLNKIQNNLVYLSDPKKNLITLKKTSIEFRTFHFVQITATGIDLVDEPSEFNSSFPPQVIYQYVAGDKLEVQIGDNASDIIVGKDIYKIQFGENHSLQDICDRYLTALKNDFDLTLEYEKGIESRLQKLQDTLQCDVPNLGKVQCIKQWLIDVEGKPATMTIALFSQKCVKEAVERAVQQLIGHQ